jgi:hypothetical protein
MHERHSRVLTVVCQSLDSCNKYRVVVLFAGCEYGGHRIQWRTFEEVVWSTKAII